jgi:hypothetical protein
MKSKFCLFVILIAIFSFMINCNQKVDLQSEEDAIRRNFDILRHGYLNRDLDTLLSIYPADYKGYAVSQGDIDFLNFYNKKIIFCSSFMNNNIRIDSGSICIINSHRSWV